MPVYEETKKGLSLNIFQLWNSGRKLGITVYSPTSDGSYSQTWKSNNLGEGSGAIDFFAGDVNGDGKTDIIQLWDSFGKLGIIVYSPIDDGGYRQS